MRKKLLLLLGCFLLMLDVQAAPAYAFRVKFKDKNGTLTFADSLQFLSSKALARRSNQGILLDSTDLPVVKSYVDTVMVTSAAVKLHNVSKWFNQIVVNTFDSMKVVDIAALPMVASLQLVARYPNGVYKTEMVETNPKFSEPIDYNLHKTRGSSAYYGLAFQQIDMIGGDCLHDLGYKGEGMDVAIFDVNFRRTDSCSAYDSLLADQRVKDVHDFVRDTNFVYDMAINSDHGMNVLGCMAANIPGTYVGTAPHANFHLYISEDVRTEQPIEEDNWLSAAERSDSLGIYLINSSLGYNLYTNLPSASYTYADMDGKTSLIAQAANKAVAKGIFVVNAQGNEGAAAWHYMLTPADGDSVYSVGSVDGSGIWSGSGYGPTFDQQIKPDGVALGKGVSLIGGTCGVGASNGSSFASPIMCGAITCLWQAAPHLKVWELRQLLHMVSSQYNTPDNTVGYGMPDFCQAYGIATNTSDITQIEYTFACYPNPTNTGSFDVRCFNASVPSYSYAIYDIQGKLVYKSNELHSNGFHCDALQQSTKGQYVLVISTGLKQYSHKISKQ